MGAKDLHRGDFVNLGTETKVLSVVGMRPQERASARKSHVSLTTFSGLPKVHQPTCVETSEPRHVLEGTGSRLLCLR